MLKETSRLCEVIPAASRTARRFCRKHRLPWLEPEDVQQDLLVDLISRLPHYDPARCSFSGFAILCFQHRISRLDVRVRREASLRHRLSLDQPLTLTTTETLADTLSNEDSYSAWLGQPLNGVQAFELEYDLDRVLGTLPEGALPICALLLRDGSDQEENVGLPRTTLHRRVRDLRCRLLAAGIGPHRGTDQRVAG